MGYNDDMVTEIITRSFNNRFFFVVCLLFYFYVGLRSVLIANKQDFFNNKKFHFFFLVSRYARRETELIIFQKMHMMDHEHQANKAFNGSFYTSDRLSVGSNSCPIACMFMLPRRILNKCDNNLLKL